MTASLRATATLAFRSPLRLASFIPQAFTADHVVDRGKRLGRVTAAFVAAMKIMATRAIRAICCVSCPAPLATVSVGNPCVYRKPYLS